jgi:hypothetical protein
MSGARHPGELIASPHANARSSCQRRTERFRIRAMPQAISENRVCFASKALKMFMPKVHAT